MGSSPRFKLPYLLNGPWSCQVQKSCKYIFYRHIIRNVMNSAAHYIWRGKEREQDYISLRSVPFRVPVIDRQDGFPEPIRKVMS